MAIDSSEMESKTDWIIKTQQLTKNLIMNLA